MSGQIFRPRCSKSSPVLAMTRSSSGGRIRLRPNASLAPPTPPDRATTRPLLIGMGSPEHVLGCGPHQFRGRIVGRAPAETAHEDGGLRLVALALDQRGGGCDLVGK